MTMVGMHHYAHSRQNFEECWVPVKIMAYTNTRKAENRQLYVK